MPRGLIAQKCLLSLTRRAAKIVHMADVDALIADPVFLELTTSEPNGAGKIVRVSAVRAGSENTEPKHFESLIRTERLTLAQCRVAGVTNADLDRAPDTDSVLDQLLEFSTGA